MVESVSGATILVVEDDEDIRRLTVLGLKQRGFDTVEAVDGTAALSMVETVAVDLVLLDGNLPELDGFVVLKRLRAMPTMATLPVIMVTGRSDLGDKIDGLGAGADDYLIKPVSLDELVARIDANLRGARAWSARLSERLRERTQLAMRIVAAPATGDVKRHVADTIAALPGVAGAGIVEVPLSGIVRAITVSDESDDSAISHLGALSSAEDFERLVAHGAAVLAQQVSRSDGSGSPHLVAATIGRRGSGALALVVEMQPPSTNERRVAGEMLGLVVELAPTVEMLIVASQSSESLAAIATSIEAVIEGGRYRPVFQPICDVGTEQIVGYEALTRFDDGVRPDVRFEEARLAGVGHHLELATLFAGIRASAALPADHYLSVNVSATLLGSGELASILDLAADRQLAIEITEHEQISDYGLVRREFAELGRSLYMTVDDAGSGWASLQHVFSLRPHFVKLDRSWITDLQSDPARQALLVGIAAAVREMGGKVVAEGIEQQAELEAVRRTGIEFAQGFLLGRPTDVAYLADG